VLRSLYGAYAKGFRDVASGIDESEADAGTVDFVTEGGRLTRVSVELEYTPHDRADRDRDVAQAQRHLERDLGKYRALPVSPTGAAGRII
jgi:hypothetical protein